MNEDQSQAQAPAQPQPTEQETKLETIFTFHDTESAEQVRAYQSIRSAALYFALAICQQTPKGSDQSAAIRKVREAVMTANAAVALKGLNF